MFDTIGDGVVLLDYENQIVSFNRAAEEVLPELSLTKRYPASAGGVLSGSPELLERIGSNAAEEERFPYQEPWAAGTGIMPAGFRSYTMPARYRSAKC